MRVGVLTGGEVEDLVWAQRLGFRSIEWMRFHDGRVGPTQRDWKPFAEAFATEAKGRGIRVSAIGALYQNPLDPKQTEFARAVFRRAIEAAAHIGANTVAGFAGAVIETELDARGGNLVYKPFENYLGRVLSFWEPRVLGMTNPIWVDGDGDGRFTAPRNYAKQIFDRAGDQPKKLAAELARYDEAVAAQAASFCQAAGQDVRSAEFEQALKTALPHVQRGFAAYTKTIPSQK